jgi:hypothetical protein
MTRQGVRTAATVLGTALLGATLVPGPADAAARSTETVAGGCGLSAGSITAGGDHRIQKVSSAPPAASTPIVGPQNLFPDGQAWLAGTLESTPVASGGEARREYVVIGYEMFATSYRTDASGTGLYPGSFSKTKIGGGWYRGGARYFEESKYSDSGYQRTNTYGLFGDHIRRWTIDSGWRDYTFYEGFDAVKTMVLISQTRTYDTFLANLKSGSLYTIRIPTGRGAPVVTKVRAATWQVFETMIAEKCGSQSTLLLGIDQDTKAGYLYAVSHADGAATVIKGLGKVPTTFPDTTYFRYRTKGSGNLFGE